VSGQAPVAAQQAKPQAKPIQLALNDTGSMSDAGILPVQPAGTIGTVSSQNIQLAGGFDESDLSKSVDQFVSTKCLGKIRREIPSEMLDVSVADMLASAGQGDAAAVKCKKLLSQDRFRK
jgi:hypothetical protein